MHKTLMAAVITPALAGTAQAQSSFDRSEEADAVAAVTAVGGTCERVVRNQPIGQLDDSTMLIAIACPGDGEQYVLSQDQRGNLAFYATCENLAKGTNNQLRCFS
jgi:hypothetical protein